MICQCRNCRNLASYRPVISIWLRGQTRQSHKPVIVYFDLKACGTCSREMAVEDVMNDQGFKHLVAALVAQGLAAPNRKIIRLDWEPIL